MSQKFGVAPFRVTGLVSHELADFGSRYLSTVNGRPLRRHRIDSTRQVVSHSAYILVWVANSKESKRKIRKQTDVHVQS